jgi:dimethylargininase
MFRHAIVRPPGLRYADALSSAGLGPPDLARARCQHEAYVAALRAVGVDIIAMAPDDEHPDATFVEDTALITPRCTVLTRPGAPSRQLETPAMRVALERRFTQLFTIDHPGTLDAGDVMMVGDHYYIGLSERTNAEGARQLAAVLGRHGLQASTVPLTAGLHLKSSVSYLEHDRMLVTEALASLPAFADYSRTVVPAGEEYAANSLWVNGTVLVPAGFPRTRHCIEALGYPTVALEMDEFRKADGGLSCLSLRW